MLSHFFNSLVATLPLAVRNSGGVAVFVRILWVATLLTMSIGGGCVNDTVVHLADPRLPFGGVGNSGMGACHGKAGFDAFTHEKSVLKKGRLDIPVRYPPYGKKHLGILKKLM